MSSLLLWAEVVASVFSVVSVYWLSKLKGKGWPVGLVSIVLTGFVYYRRNLYGSALLQVFFFASQSWGWKRWHKIGQGNGRPKCRSLTSSEYVQATFCLLALWGLVVWALSLGPGLYRVADGFVTSASLVAQVLMVLQIRQCWPLWILINFVYVGLSVAQGLWAFTLLYGVFFVLAWQGWREWTREDQP